MIWQKLGVEIKEVLFKDVQEQVGIGWGHSWALEKPSIWLHFTNDVFLFWPDGPNYLT